MEIPVVENPQKAVPYMKKLKKAAFSLRELLVSLKRRLVLSMRVVVRRSLFFYRKYRKRFKKFAKSNEREIREILLSLSAVTCGNMVPGLIMGTSSHYFTVLPALIILIPGSIDMRGNIFGSLGSRLSTYLHTGELEPTFRRTPALVQNMASTVGLTLVMSAFLGVLAHSFAVTLGIGTDVLTLMLVSFFAGITSGAFMLFATFVIAFFSFRFGLDPDNIVSPIITFLGDFLTLPFLFVSFDLLNRMPLLERRIGLIILLAAVGGSLVSGLRLKKYCRRILVESIPVFCVCGILSSLSGSLLSTRVEAIIPLAGILTLVPAILEDGGAIGGVLSARFSSALHLGTMEVSRTPPSAVFNLFGVMHLIGLPVFSLLGLLAFGFNSLFEIPSPGLTVFVVSVIITGQILILAVNIVSYYLTMGTYRANMDPDNTTIPVITSIMDITGTGVLLAVLTMVGIL